MIILSNIRFVKRKITEVGEKPCCSVFYRPSQQQPRGHFLTSVYINVNSGQKNAAGGILRLLRRNSDRSEEGKRSRGVNLAAVKINAVGGVLRALRGEIAPLGDKKLDSTGRGLPLRIGSWIPNQIHQTGSGRIQILGLNPTLLDTSEISPQFRYPKEGKGIRI